MISDPRWIKLDEIRLFHNSSGWKSSSSKWLPVEIRYCCCCFFNLFFNKKHRFLILHFPNSTFSQNQSATITLNTGSPRTLVKILVILNATGYMFTSSSGFAFIHFEVYSTHSSKTTGNSPAISTFNRWLFLKLNQWFICNKSPVLPGQLPVSNWEVYLILRKIQHQFNL
jgi:hypothetical protein